MTSQVDDGVGLGDILLWDQTNLFTFYQKPFQGYSCTLSALYSINVLDCLETNSHSQALACVKSKCENVK